jgi:hypothetical protein
MSEEVVRSMITVIGEMILLKHKKRKLKKNKEWVRKWIQRRNNLGVTNTLVKELAIEDPKSFYNFLRMNEEMFDILLNKVS